MGLPPVSDQVNHIFIGRILYATEYVTKILKRINIVCLAICKDSQRPGKSYSSFGATNKETIVAVLRQSMYFSLDAIKTGKLGTCET